jgi:hypothetical protein
MGNEKHWQHARLLEAFVLVEIDFQLMCDSLLLMGNEKHWQQIQILECQNIL